MKTIKEALADWSGKASIATGCLLLSLGFNAAAQPFASPVGDWDVVMSGTRSGVARFTFNSDHTITAVEILIPKQLVTLDTHTATDSRGTGGDDSRQGIPTNAPTTLPPHTNLFGFVGFPSSELNFTNFNGNGDPTGAIWVHDGVPAGQWNFDGSGKVVGFFTELSAPSAIITNLIAFGQPVVSDCQTVVVTDSNGQPSLVQVCLTNQPYLTNVEVLRLTNAINFTAKVFLDGSDFMKSRITLLASTPAGRATFSGVIPIELPDVSGEWYGLLRRQGLPYNEFFTLSNPDFNFYALDGVDPGLGGPGYLFEGSLLIVRQKKFGYVVDVQPPPFPTDEHILHIRAVTGNIDLTRGKLTSQQGLQDSGFTADSSGSTVDRISYKAILLPPPTE